MAAKQNAEHIDMLTHIFELQEALNDYVFDNNNITAVGGAPLRMSDIAAAANSGQLTVNDLPNQWLGRYTRAIEEELRELSEDFLWKWWSKDALDLQSIRVELVDILHFLVSAMIAAGLTPETVYSLYRQKHAVNVRRQDTGYSQRTKTEEDNRTIE
ncbi:MAG TPA: dUTPase [Thermoguttaceae bacterium]|nr:dUTPase [Thermoguttaceae bacterium]